MGPLNFQILLFRNARGIVTLGVSPRPKSEVREKKLQVLPEEERKAALEKFKQIESGENTWTDPSTVSCPNASLRYGVSRDGRYYRSFQKLLVVGA